MGNTPHQNTSWGFRVHSLMREGFGFEDIAVMIGCSAHFVRAEAKILREEGRLARMYGSAI